MSQSVKHVIPTISEIKTEIIESGSEELRAESIFEEKYQADAAEREKNWAHIEGLRDHYQHKKWWSLFLIGLMASMVLFQMLLLGLVGSKIWDFTSYKWLLPLLLVQNLAQIVGLAVFVVKSLFKDVL